MKRLSDKSKRIVTAVISLSVALILMLVYFNAIAPGGQGSLGLLITFFVVSLLLFAFAIFEIIIFMLILRKEIIRGKRKEKENSDGK